MRVYSIDYEAFEQSKEFEEAVERANRFEPDFEDQEPQPHDMAAFALAKMKEYQQLANMMGKIFLELMNWE